MIQKDKEVIVFDKPKMVEDVLDHFKNIEKRQIHSLNATFACDMVVFDQLKRIFEETLLKNQDSLKHLKICFDATPLTQEDLLSLTKFIGRMKSIRHLELSFGFCNLNLPSIVSLVEGVVSLSELKSLKLDLSGNPILSDSHQLLGELWKVPSKCFKLKLCQCNISILKFSFDNYPHKSSGNFLREYTSSSKQEYQKQGNQQSLQNQQQQQGQQGQRKSIRSLSNTNQNDEVSSENDKKEVSSSNVFGITDQKSDNQNSSNIYPVQGELGKQQFQNTQMDPTFQQRKGASTRSRLQSANAENKGKLQQQQKKLPSRQRSAYNSQGVVGDINLNSNHTRKQNSTKLENKEGYEGFEEEEEGDQISKTHKQLDNEYNEASQDYDKGFLDEKVTPTTQNNTGKFNNYSRPSEKQDIEDDHELTIDMELEDEEYNGEEVNEEFSEQNSQDLNEEDCYQERYYNKKQKINMKKTKGSSANRNINTRSAKKEGGIQKKAISKSKFDASNSQTRKDVLPVSQVAVNATSSTSSIITHSKTAGKGEAYFKRTYRNSSNNNEGISKMNATDNTDIQPETPQGLGDTCKTETLNTLVSSLHQQRQNSQQYIQETNSIASQGISAQTAFSQVKLQNDNLYQMSNIVSPYFKNDRSNLIQNITQNIGSQNHFNQQLLQPHNQQSTQQSSNQYLIKRQQKRVIEKIVIDLRQNPNLQEQTLETIANTLTTNYSQVNEFHLKTPDNLCWDQLNILEFGVCLPSVLDIKIDPIGYTKIAFTNMIKGISTAFRKLKFGERLKNIPNTQQIQEELQNWFCPEKDFVVKKGLVKEDTLESKEMLKNLDIIEQEDYRYQQIFFRSLEHSICTVCQNEANELHYLQANTQGLYFCYSQEDIEINSFCELLDKVQINLHNQFQQIFNEGEIRENLCTNDQHLLFTAYLNKNFHHLREESINKLQLPVQTQHKYQQQNDSFILNSPQDTSVQQTAELYSFNQDSQSQLKLNQQHSLNSPQLPPFQLPPITPLSQQQISNPINKSQQYAHQTYYNHQLKFNSFQKKLEKALKLKLIESVNMQFTFQDYYYEEQYDLVQKIYNIIKIISLRINIYKLYLSVYQGISPLILSQILFIDELGIDKIEAGSCFKEGNIFYINLSNPKYIIQKDDLQIFAQTVNANASFEEIHINFDKKQDRFMQSISHLLTRYRQTINKKDLTLTIYRENILPVNQFTQSIDEYLEMVDESGNFLDEMSTQLPQPNNKSISSPFSCDRKDDFNCIEQEEKQDCYEENHEKVDQQSLSIINYSSNENQNSKSEDQHEEKIEIEDQNEQKIEIEDQNEDNQSPQKVANQNLEETNQEINETPTQEKKKEKVKKPRSQSKRKSKKTDEEQIQQENGINKESVEQKSNSKKRNYTKSESNKNTTATPKRTYNKSNKKGKKQEKDNSEDVQNNENLDNLEDNKQEQKSSPTNQHLDNEEKAYNSSLNSAATINNTNSNNSKGEQFCSNINRLSLIEKTNQNPQQLLY